MHKHFKINNKVIVKAVESIIILSVLSLLFSSCVTSKRLNYLQEPSYRIPSYAADSVAQDYKLQLGDQLYINVSSINKEASDLFTSQTQGAVIQDLYSYTIYADSCIEFPFVGAIKLVGLTTRQAKDTLKTKLQLYLLDCNVDVRLANSYFTLVGEGGNGRFPIPKEKLNVFQVLAIVGDFSTITDRSEIHILRPTPAGTQIKVFDIRSKDIINSEYYYIRPNDVIYVQNFNGQFFRVESFGQLLSTITTTLSFGYLMYTLTTE